MAISDFYDILSETVPGLPQLTNEQTRITSGFTTYAKALKDIYNSPNRVAGNADEWAEAFFVLTGRAPDYATYKQGMTLLRSGTTFSALMDTILALPGHKLSTSAFPDNRVFFVEMLRLLAPSWLQDPSIINYFVALLDSGTTTRGSLLSAGLHSADPLLHGGRANLVQKSLIFLAATQNEATSGDLFLAGSGLDNDILQSLATVGLATPPGFVFFSQTSKTSPDMKIKGDLTKDLVFNLDTDVYTLGGVKNFDAYYSFDGGIDAGKIKFNASYTTTVATLDASEAIGTGKLIATGDRTTPATNYYFKAPAAGSTLKGANGDDTLIGGDGVDKLIATQGNDTLTGEDNIDTFVFAQAAYYRGGVTQTIITDFGNGADILDVSLLLGTRGTTPGSVTPLLSSDTSQTLANGGVAVIENDGDWTNTSPASIHATASDVVNLWGTVFFPPTAASRYVIITADLSNDADVWLVNNDTLVKTIEPTEVVLLGQIYGDWNVMLNGLIPILR